MFVNTHKTKEIQARLDTLAKAKPVTMLNPYILTGYVGKAGKAKKEQQQ